MEIRLELGDQVDIRLGDSEEFVRISLTNYDDCDGKYEVVEVRRCKDYKSGYITQPLYNRWDLIDGGEIYP